MEAADLGELSEAVILERQSQFEKRLEVIEKTIDLQPREILELVSLRDNLKYLGDELESAQIQMFREVERAYNMVLTVTAGLLITGSNNGDRQFSPEKELANVASVGQCQPTMPQAGGDSPKMRRLVSFPRKRESHSTRRCPLSRA
jgi:hypothetical protein